MAHHRMRAMTLVGVAIGLVSVAAAEPSPSDAGIPESQGTVPSHLSSRLHTEITVRLKSELGVAPVAVQPEAVSPDESETELLVLDPMLVKERKIPLVPPPPESKLEKFFRDGVLLERVGHRVTTRLWMRGDKGLMLSFDF